MQAALSAAGVSGYMIRTGAAAAAVREKELGRVVAILALALLASGCGDKEVAAPTPASEASSEEILKKNCADEKWREENLGLWYSVCRQPLRW